MIQTDGYGSIDPFVDGYMEQEEEWEREGLLDPAWEKQQKKVLSTWNFNSFAIISYPGIHNIITLSIGVCIFYEGSVGLILILTSGVSPNFKIIYSCLLFDSIRIELFGPALPRSSPFSNITLPPSRKSTPLYQSEKTMLKVLKPIRTLSYLHNHLEGTTSPLSDFPVYIASTDLQTDIPKSIISLPIIYKSSTPLLILTTFLKLFL